MHIAIFTLIQIILSCYHESCETRGLLIAVVNSGLARGVFNVHVDLDLAGQKFDGLQQEQS